MTKTERVKLDIDKLPDELYNLILKEFEKTRENVMYVDEWEISADVKHNEG